MTAAPPLAEAAAPPACTGKWTLFFGPDGETFPARLLREEQAKAVCGACPVLASCREYALETEARPGQYGAYGIWGGLTAEERNVIRRARPRPARQVSPRCRNGHARTPQNTRTEADGGIACRDCERERKAAA